MSFSSPLYSNEDRVVDGPAAADGVKLGAAGFSDWRADGAMFSSVLGGIMLAVDRVEVRIQIKESSGGRRMCRSLMDLVAM